MVALSEPVARLALTFSTPEYFALVLFGLASVVCLGGGSSVNAFIVAVASACSSPRSASTAPTAPTASRSASTSLRDGIEYLGVMVGAYGLGEVLSRLEQGFTLADAARSSASIETKLPSAARDRRASRARSRARSLLGIVVGIVPGAGATIASFLSYGVEAQYGRRRKEMGTGIPEGIVAPQAAATASVGGAMIPLLTMGIPGSRRHRHHPRRLHAAGRAAGRRRCSSTSRR